MDFGLSDEQRLLQDTVRTFLRDQLPATRVRALCEGETAGRREIWRALAELGVAGIAIPPQYGGSGLPLLDAALVAEELGRCVAPVPFLSTAVLAPVAFAEAGTPEQCAAWLPQIATGALCVGAALTESYAEREGGGVRSEAGRLEGKALLALDVPHADYLLVATTASQLAWVTSGAPGLEVEPLATIDRTRHTAELRFRGVEPAAWIGGPATQRAALERILDAGRAALTFDVLGAAEAMLDQAVAYAQERVQFGRVVASFQAVKHLCAEMVAELEPTRSLAWYAAHAFHALPDAAPLAIAHAKSHGSDVATQVADLATQVHGGIGYTDEQNLHLWFKRIGLDRQLLGGPAVLRDRAARLQGWVEADPHTPRPEARGPGSRAPS